MLCEEDAWGPKPPEPPGIWERCIDQRRRAVYYWEHNRKVSSWDVPAGGWWERLKAENGDEFFWNSETQQTVCLGNRVIRKPLWHVPNRWNLPLEPSPWDETDASLGQ